MQTAKPVGLSQRRTWAASFKRCWQLYLFLLLPIAYVLIFEYVPMAGIQIAFKKYNPRLGIWGSPLVGLDNFTRFFESYQFRRVLWNTLALSIYSVAAAFPIPILFALLMNSLPNERVKRFTQSIVSIPHFISVVVCVGMLMQIFNSRTGLYGVAVESLTGSYPKDLFGSPTNFRHLYIWSGVWASFGWNAIIYTAALSNVSASQHEAAQIDGANRLKRVIHVDLPAIVPTIAIMLILRMGTVMSMNFEKVYLMQNSLNISASETIATYVYKIGLSSAGTMDFSYSTAINLFNSVINMILVVTVNGITGKLSKNSLW